MPEMSSEKRCFRVVRASMWDAGHQNWRFFSGCFVKQTAPFSEKWLHSGSRDGPKNDNVSIPACLGLPVSENQSAAAGGYRLSDPFCSTFDWLETV